MITPKIFVTGASTRGMFHRLLISVLHDEGANTWLYEWTSGDDPLSAEVLQALYQHPITLITVSDVDFVPDRLPRLIRIAKTITIYNPARLVLPLPTEPINADHLKNVFPFAEPLIAYHPLSEADVIARVLIFLGLRPQNFIEKSFPHSQLLIAQSLISQKCFEEAIGWLLPLINIPKPPYGARSALAYCYARLEQWKACVETSKAAFEQALERTLSSYCLGLGLNGLGQYEAAVPAFRRALSTNENISGAWVGLGIALKRLGNYTDALQAFERGLAVSFEGEWAYEGPTSFAEAQHYITQMQQILGQ